MLLISILLLILGYSLVLPTMAKYSTLLTQKTNVGRLWLVAHQLGLLIAALGWALRRQLWLAVGHVLVALILKYFFDSQQRRQQTQQPSQRDG